MNYIWHMLFMFSILTMLTVSLDLVVGHLGLLILCQSAFYAIGAYVTTLLILRHQMPFIVAVIFGCATSALFSIPLALTSRKLRRDAVVLASLAFLLILLDLLKNLRSLTGGLEGISDIPPLRIAGLNMVSLSGQASMCFLIAMICWTFSQRITRSAFGYFLHALRDDFLLAVGLRINPSYFYIRTFSISAAIAGLAGSFYACYATYINPAVFTADLSILVLVMLLLGGAGTRYGALVGALAIVMLTEVTRFLGMGSPSIGSLYQIVLGSFLVLFATTGSKGLLGGYEFK